jgi:hypothetical protein
MVDGWDPRRVIFLLVVDDEEQRRKDGLTFTDRPEQLQSDSLSADGDDDVRVQNYYTLGGRNI